MRLCLCLNASFSPPFTHSYQQGRASLDSFRGLIFVGGFSYADVLDSAKGWAGGRT